MTAACKIVYGRACKHDAEMGAAYCNAKRQCLDQGAPDSCPSSPYVFGDPWPAQAGTPEVNVKAAIPEVNVEDLPKAPPPVVNVEDLPKAH
jgi:hypothetical protein